MHALVREIIPYALVTAVAFAVDVALLTVLVEVAGWPPVAAAAVGFIVGGFVAYLLSVRFVFRYRRVGDRRVEATSFIALGLVGLAINVGLMALAIELLAVHYLVGKLCAATVTFLVNYALRRLVLFTRWTKEDPQGAADQ